MGQVLPWMNRTKGPLYSDRTTRKILVKLYIDNYKLINEWATDSSRAMVLFYIKILITVALLC